MKNTVDGQPLKEFSRTAAIVRHTGMLFMGHIKVKGLTMNPYLLRWQLAITYLKVVLYDIHMRLEVTFQLHGTLLLL